MKTNNLFLKALAVMCAITMSIMFTACGGDDDDNPNNENTPVEVVMLYSLSSNEEMRNLLDITIEYYDADGNVQTEMMTEDVWSREIRTKLPATLGTHVNYQLKDGIDINTVGNPVFTYGYELNGSAKNSKGKTICGSVFKKSGASIRLKEGKLPDWLARHSNSLVNFRFDYDVNGKVTEGSW